MKMRVAIACGGTGGHLFPGVAVAEELCSRGHEALLLVSPKQIDAVALRGSGLNARQLPAAGWPGAFSARTPGFFWKLGQTWSQCRDIFREFEPSAVLGMGGFTSAVPLYVGRHRHIPTYLHESNAIPGKVTRLLAAKVNRVLLGFGVCAEYLEETQCVVTGTPVRAGLQKLERAVAAEKFGLNPSAKTLVVMGGSQGAHGLNHLILKALAAWEPFREEWQFIHLTGPADAEIVEINYRRSRFTSVVKPFSSDMAAIYSLADLVVSRSGAASLTELSHYGLPALLVPFPAAAEDHQTRNAEVFTRAGAAVLLPEATTSPEVLGNQVIRLLTDDAARHDMARAAANLAGEAAAGRVVDELEKWGKTP
jgi:UDP-N-acetylglucosamine--N-acetylmuramyl-(pentapeptide) pyrophosphoryl-undecaprenol N-acetylglucosamine transferase